MMIAFTTHIEFNLYQICVKRAFLNSYLQEEAYIKQPLGFEDNEHPNYVYKLDKVLYGLKQIPRTWYDQLSSYLLSRGCLRGKIDNTIFLKSKKKHSLIV